MTNNTFTFPVVFESDPRNELFGFYTFSVIPQIGDEVVGEEGIYQIKQFAHAGGLGIDAVPVAEIILCYLRPADIADDPET